MKGEAAEGSMDFPECMLSWDFGEDPLDCRPDGRRAVMRFVYVFES